MLTTNVPGALPTYTFPMEQDRPQSDGDTVKFSGEMVPLLTGSYARITAIRQNADFSIGIKPQGEISLVRDVFISPRARETAKGLHPSELGWTREEAMHARARLNAWAEEWDDPEMDEYNIYL